MIFSASEFIPYANCFQNATAIHTAQSCAQAGTSHSWAVALAQLLATSMGKEMWETAGAEPVYTPVNTGRLPHCGNAWLVSLMQGWEAAGTIFISRRSTQVL